MADIEEDNNLNPHHHHTTTATTSNIYDTTTTTTIASGTVLPDGGTTQQQEWYIDLGDEQLTSTTTAVQSDYITDPQSTAVPTASNSNGSEPFDDFRTHLSKEMAGQLWAAGRQSTQKFINTYAHIDILRPYFDVEPVQFRNRLLFSFIPDIKISAPQEAPSELYGPTMLVFTLVAILLYGMKTSGHTVEDGTLIGTALIVCLGYWLGVGMLSFFISYLLTAHLSLLQLLSLIGYSLSAHCLILMLSTLFDHYGLPSMFYLLWLFIGLLTMLKQVGVLISRSWTIRDGLILSAITGVSHLLSILYLRFAYHKVYQAVAEVL